MIDCIRMGLQDVLLACNTCTWRVHQDFFAVCLPIEDAETNDRCSASLASVLSTWRGTALSSAPSKRSSLFQKLRVTLAIVRQAARYGCLRSVAASVHGPGLEHTVVGCICLQPRQRTVVGHRVEICFATIAIPPQHDARDCGHHARSGLDMRAVCA